MIQVDVGSNPTPTTNYFVATAARNKKWQEVWKHIELPLGNPSVYRSQLQFEVNFADCYSAAVKEMKWKMKTVIFDIDGTLSDASHRMHHILNKPKNWKQFFGEVLKDSANTEIINIAKSLKQYGYVIIIMTGRSEVCRVDTEQWLKNYDIAYDALYMRKEGDYRPDDTVKSEFLDKAIGDGYNVIMAFEDRDRVVKMFRNRGIKCLQVADGAF